jgi:hypothetical protein
MTEKPKRKRETLKQKRPELSERAEVVTRS